MKIYRYRNKGKDGEEGRQNRINEESRYQSVMRNQKEVKKTGQGVRWNRCRGWVSAGGDEEWCHC
jgi:hypothetical protein